MSFAARLQGIFHFMSRTQFTRAVYTSPSSSVGIEFLGLDPQGCLKGQNHLTKIDTLRHCCDQQRTSSLTQTQRLLQHHAGCRFCSGSATESAHDGTIQMATTTWPVVGGNLSGFSREMKHSPHPLQELSWRMQHPVASGFVVITSRKMCEIQSSVCLFRVNEEVTSGFREVPQCT